MNGAGIGSVICALALGAVGCTAGAEDQAGPSTDDGAGNEVVGVGDLALVEKTFGLTLDTKVNGAFSRDVTKGACHRAYVPAGAQFRRYKNGAAFFMPEDAQNRERGKDRPVLCVDLDDASLSLDGVGLDAAFRFGLGKPIGSDAAPGGEVNVVFERGALHMLVTDSVRGPSPSKVASLREVRGAKLVAEPTFIGGTLLDLTVKNAKVYEPFSGETMTHDLNVSGTLAAFAYSVAYKKAGTAFSLGRDPLGALANLSETSDLKAEQGGDGPGWWQGLYFPIATISEAGYWEGDEGPTSKQTRTFRMTGPANPGEPYVAKAEVECEMVIDYANEQDQRGTARAPKCRGL